MKLTNKERIYIAHALDHLKNNTIDDVDYGGFGGWYTGNRQHFIKRHKEAIAYFNNLLDRNTNTTNEMSTSTPRTDAATKLRDTSGPNSSTYRWVKEVPRQFACELERELAACIQALESITNIYIKGDDTHNDYIAMGRIAIDCLDQLNKDLTK